MFSSSKLQHVQYVSDVTFDTWLKYKILYFSQFPNVSTQNFIKMDPIILYFYLVNVHIRDKIATAVIKSNPCLISVLLRIVQDDSHTSARLFNNTSQSRW